MIITISGKAGSGKSTVAKLLAQKLNLKHYSTGDFMRSMAKEKGISLIEIGKLAETDPNIDKELDDRQKKLGKEQTDFVIDGRLTAVFIPHAEHRVFLDADEEVRARRILGAQRQDEANTDLQTTMQDMTRREESEIKRYKEYYSVDFTEKKHYTQIVNTNSIDQNQVVEQILKNIQ